MHKQNTMTALALIAALGMSGQALAADPMSPAPATGATGATGTMPDRTTAAVDAIGKDVVNQVGQDIGEVQDIVAETSTNEVYAVISVGGFLGVGEKDVVVPLSSLNVGGENVILMSQNSVDSLKASPAYDPARYRSVSMSNDRGGSGGTLPTTPKREGGDENNMPGSPGTGIPGSSGTGLDGGATQ